MNVSNNKAEKEMEQTKPTTKMLVLKCRGHIPIRDAETKEEFVNKRNAIPLW